MDISNLTLGVRLTGRQNISNSGPWHMVNSPTCFAELKESLGSKEFKLSTLSLCGLVWEMSVCSGCGRSAGVVVLREEEEQMESQSEGGSIN